MNFAQRSCNRQWYPAIYLSNANALARGCNDTVVLSNTGPQWCIGMFGGRDCRRNFEFIESQMVFKPRQIRKCESNQRSVLDFKAATGDLLKRRNHLNRHEPVC